MEVEPRRNGHQARSERSTRRLLCAAGDLVAEGGYQSMTLAGVGLRAGYSRSLATARFGSKSRLLEALFEEIVAGWNGERERPPQETTTGLKALREMLIHIADSFDSDPRSVTILYALLFEAVGPVPGLRERFVALLRNQRARIAGYIRDGIKDGTINHAIDPEKQATVIVAQLHGVGYQWKLHSDGTPSSAVLTAFIVQVIREMARSQTVEPWNEIEGDRLPA